MRPQRPPEQRHGQQGWEGCQPLSRHSSPPQPGCLDSQHPPEKRSPSLHDSLGGLSTSHPHPAPPHALHPAEHLGARPVVALIAGQPLPEEP